MVFPARKSKFWLINYWAWDQLALTAANEIWCQRLPRGITNASRYYSYYCAKRKKEGKFSTIVCGSVHVAQKTLVVLVVQKVFKSRLVKKVFFLLYFTILFFNFLVSICFFLLYFWPRFDVLKSEKTKHFQSCFRKPCYAIKLAEMPVVNQLTRKKKPHPEIIGFLLSIMCCRPSASFKVNWSKAFLWRKRPHRVCMPEDNFFHYFAAKHCCRSCCSLLSLPSVPWRTVGVVQH